MIDYQALLDKLNPRPDGEGVTKLRTGVVSVVNANGTLDVAISGVVIPGLPRVIGIPLAVGDVVSVITYLGAMLVIGAVGGNLPVGRDGAIHGMSSVTNSAGITTETVVLTGAPALTTFKAGRVYEMNIYGLTQGTTGNNHVYRVRKTNAAGQQLLESRSYVQANTPVRATGLFKVSTTDVSATLVVTLEAPATAIYIAGATFPRGFYILDIGSESNPAYANVPALT